MSTPPRARGALRTRTSGGSGELEETHTPELICLAKFFLRPQERPTTTSQEEVHAQDGPMKIRRGRLLVRLSRHRLHVGRRRSNAGRLQFKLGRARPSSATQMWWTQTYMPRAGKEPGRRQLARSMRSMGPGYKKRTHLTTRHNHSRGAARPCKAPPFRMTSAAESQSSARKTVGAPNRWLRPHTRPTRTSREISYCKLRSRWR